MKDVVFYKKLANVYEELANVYYDLEKAYKELEDAQLNNKTIEDLRHCNVSLGADLDTLQLEVDQLEEINHRLHRTIIDQHETLAKEDSTCTS